MSDQYYGVEPYTGKIICHYRTKDSRNGYSFGKLVDAAKVAKGKLDAAGNYIYDKVNNTRDNIARYIDRKATDNFNKWDEYNKQIRKIEREEEELRRLRKLMNGSSKGINVVKALREKERVKRYNDNLLKNEKKRNKYFSNYSKLYDLSDLISSKKYKQNKRAKTERVNYLNKAYDAGGAVYNMSNPSDVALASVRTIGSKNNPKRR